MKLTLKNKSVDAFPAIRSKSMNADAIAQEYSKKVRTALGARIKDIILFGSRARGNSTEYSDYDMMIIVDKRDKSLLETVVTIEVDILDKYERLVGSIVYEQGEWNRKKQSPLGMNIRKDGVQL